MNEGPEDEERPKKGHPVKECVGDLHMVFVGLTPLLPSPQAQGETGKQSDRNQIAEGAKLFKGLRMLSPDSVAAPMFISHGRTPSELG